MIFLNTVVVVIIIVVLLLLLVLMGPSRCREHGEKLIVGK